MEVSVDSYRGHSCVTTSESGTRTVEGADGVRFAKLASSVWVQRKIQESPQSSAPRAFVLVEILK
jgi:hypothetical protein